MALSDSARGLIDIVDRALKTPGWPRADSLALEKTKEGLVDGIAGMRAWMSALRPPDDATAHEEAMAALENSRARLEEIGGNLNRALASAAAIPTRPSHRLH